MAEDSSRKIDLGQGATVEPQSPSTVPPSEGVARFLIAAEVGRLVSGSDRAGGWPEVLDGARAGERLRYLLEERIAELEVRLRERAIADDIHELELRSMQHELDLKAAYVTRLEIDGQALRAQLTATQAECVQIGSQSEARVAELGALIDAMRRRTSYRLIDALAAVARPVIRPLRRVLRKVRRR